MGTKPREMSGKVFKSDPDRAFGRESRSLKACYELYEVRCVEEATAVLYIREFAPDVANMSFNVHKLFPR